MFTEKGFWRSKEGEALKTVMSTVILQDVLLSLDNVLVVAGNSHGDLHLTIVGVLISIVMMGTIANLMVSLVKKYPILGLIGGLALAKAAHNLFVESYNHEAGVAAFGTIVVFVMFSRVYQRLTTDDEEVKPLSLDLDEPLTEGNEAGEVDVPEPVAAAAATAAVPATTMMPHEVTQELLAYLRRNTEALQRIEATLEKRGVTE